MVIKTIENMKEQFINEVADAMSEVLNFEQMVELNNALLQVISKYELVDNGEKVREDVKNNNRILEIFLSAKQVEGCSIKTIKYYETTIRQLYKKMPKNVRLVYWDYYSYDPAHYERMCRQHMQLAEGVVFANGVWTWNGFTSGYDKAFGSIYISKSTSRDNPNPCL